MAHMPKLFCAHCNGEMKPHHNGILLQADSQDGRPYCKVASDQWSCPQCGTSVLYVSPNTEPVAAHEQGYDAHQEDRKVHFAKRLGTEHQDMVTGAATADSKTRRGIPLP